MSTARSPKKDRPTMDRWLTAYVDDELDVVHTLQVEEQLEECSQGTEQVQLMLAMRSSLKKACETRCPGDLRARLEATVMACEPEAPVSDSNANLAEGSEAKVPPPVAAVSLSFWRSLGLPLAAAATLALVIGAMLLRQREAGGLAADSTKPQVDAMLSLDSLLEDLVATHAQPPPPETTDPDGLSRFDPYIGVRVRRPAFDPLKAKYVGARLHRRTAMLQYVMNRHRVSVYMFDPKRVPLKGKRLQARHIGARSVYVGRVRGFSVAASERHGVGYAVASDMADDKTAELVLAAAQ